MNTQLKRPFTSIQKLQHGLFYKYLRTGKDKLLFNKKCKFCYDIELLNESLHNFLFSWTIETNRQLIFILISLVTSRGWYGFSNQRQIDCFFLSMLRLITKVTVGFPSQWVDNAVGVSMSWRHNGFHLDGKTILQLLLFVFSFRTIPKSTYSLPIHLVSIISKSRFSHWQFLRLHFHRFQTKPKCGS